MNVYRWVWSVVAYLAVLLGLLFALAESWLTSVILFIITGLCAGVLSANIRSDDAHHLSRRIGSDMGRCSVIAVAVFGLGASIGAQVAPLLAAMAVTCPPLVAKLACWLNGTEPDPVNVDDAAMADLNARAESVELPDEDGLEELSTEKLCHEWCRTSLQLLRTTEPQAIATIAAGRERLLEELERRNPEGVTTWLNSGARAFSDPRKFLADR